MSSREVIVTGSGYFYLSFCTNFRETAKYKI